MRFLFLHVHIERAQSGVAGGRAELLLDPEELVVLGDPLGTARGAGLDLAGVECHREIGHAVEAFAALYLIFPRIFP